MKADITIGELEARLDALDRMIQQRFSDQEKSVNTALTAADKAVNAAMSAAKEAVNKAEAASEKRFESVNEFRAQLKDQQGTLVPRSEADVRFTAMTAEIQRLGERLTAMETKLGQSTGKSEGANSSWAIVIVVVSVLIAAVSVAVNLFKG